MAGQLGNTINGSTPVPLGALIENDTGDVVGETVAVEGTAPVSQLNGAVLRNIGAQYKTLFDKFAGERVFAEQKWLKNLRQYLGIYDPDIERQLAKNRSRAYPRLTRVKCISMLSRLMNLMFPGNETNWELNASPSPSMSAEMVAQAVTELMQELMKTDPQIELTQDIINEAVNALAAKNAADLTKLVLDQLTELGGNQTIDWVTLNRKVTDSAIKYGIGVLEGPFVRAVETSGWMMQAAGPDGAAGFKPVTKTTYKPQFDFLPVWDFYPDMSARDLPGEGYFVRKVLGRAALRKLADRPDFFGTQVRQVLTYLPNGNYRARSFETELKTMGVSQNAESGTSNSSGREKYEIVIWKGPVSAAKLIEAGAEVPENMRVDDVEAELWIIDNWVIKAEVNAWRKMGLTMQQAHIFQFDEDDTSPIGQGLPGIVRDSQLSICAATRMSLDNASITCGPNMEVNTALLRADQDLNGIEPYKLWYRDDEGPSSQFPAVRRIEIDGHLPELQSLVRMFLEFAEMETFIGGATGGDMAKQPSEPLRTAAGASMLRGDAALPFKDIVRNYDRFTQSVIWGVVQFNKKFNPDDAPEGDYAVIPRGATSLVAKELRGQQVDMLSQSLTPEERDHVDERKFVEVKFSSRDMQSMLVSEDTAKRRKDARAQVAADDAAKTREMLDAQIKEVLTNAFKNVAQAQKNTAGADATSVKAATEMIAAGEPANDQGKDN